MTWLTHLLETPAQRRERLAIEEARRYWQRQQIARRLEALPSVSHRAAFAARDENGRFKTSGQAQSLTQDKEKRP